jgi:hypothetical protein
VALVGLVLMLGFSGVRVSSLPDLPDPTRRPLVLFAIAF